MKTRFLKFIPLLVLALGVLPQQVCRADVSGQMIRGLSAKYQTSAVTLSLVIKIGSGSSQSQAEMEAGGILLDDSGLVVTTNTGIDPMAAYAQEAEQYGAGMTTSVVGVKILLAGGTEIPAKVVLRDKDKNLAFVRPLKKPRREIIQHFVRFQRHRANRRSDLFDGPPRKNRQPRVGNESRTRGERDGKTAPLLRAG